MLKLTECPIIIQAYTKAKKQLTRKIFLNCHNRHLSKVIPVEKKHGIVKKKLEEVISWYDEFTGMDEVRNAQKRVVEDEQNFRRTQDERRNILNELKEIQSKIKDLYVELDTTNRGDERYVHLITEEHILLKEEKTILEKFAVAEKNERDSFAALSTSVKLSHEKERAQSERTKYWSIIGSVLGTVIGILGTSINNHFKMNELKELIKSTSDKKLLQNLNHYLENNEKLSARLKESALLHNSSITNEEFLNKLNLRLNNLEKCLNNIEQNNQKINLNRGNEDSYKITEPDTLADIMKKEITQTKILLFTLAVLSILMPIITKYS